MSATSASVITTVLLAPAIVLILVRFGMFAHLHAVRRDLEPLHNTVSDLGTGTSRREFTVMGALTAVAYVLVLIATALAGVGPIWALVVGLLGVAAQVAMFFFPTDLTGTGTTTIGTLHGLFLAMVNLDLGTSSLAVAVTWVVRVTFYAFLASLVLPKLRRSVLGLTERAFLVATPLWFLTLAGLLLAA
jgi:hypothetical protein